MIHVLQTGNSKIFHGICLNVLSILKYTSEPIHLHIMTMEISWSDVPKISEESCNHLREVMKNANPLNELSYYDVSVDFEETFRNTPNMNPKYSPASLIRLLFPRYIDCDKLIYLDADTMTCSSLEEFYTIDIEDKEMAICKDYLGKFWIKKDYFNSGVLYINVKKVKETRLFERAVELLQKKKLYFSDQSALYILCKEKVYIPFRFNEQRDIKPDTVVKHFCKGIRYFPFFKIYNYKQWNVKKIHNFFHIYEFDDLYEQYERLFPNELKLIYE